MATFRAPHIVGTVRLGCPDDYALAYIPPILKRFAATHPAVQVDVRCSPSSELMRVDQGRRTGSGADVRRTPAGGLAGHGAVARTAGLGNLDPRLAAQKGSSLPLALADRERYLAKGQDCEWANSAATAQALDKSWAAGNRVVGAYVGVAKLGTHAPVVAGLAITVSTLSWLPHGLRPLGPDEGLPPLPDFGILMLKAQNATQPVTDALATHIGENFQAGSARTSEPLL